MTLEERSRLSYYRELAVLNAEHDVKLVQHSESGLLFVRKTLVNYQPEIFRQLIADPVPNMPRIVEAVEDEGRLTVIETYLAGRTLQDIFDERELMPVLSVCRIGRQLCGILSVLHARGIIHRDVKLSNIILSEDGVVKLLDLDAAKVYRPDEDRDTKLIGTQGFAAPEQYGFGASSPATDIYAVGVVLNVLSTGAFPGTEAPADEDLADVIRECTRMEPGERFCSAEALSTALHAVEQKATAARTQAGKNVFAASDEETSRDYRRENRLPGFRSGRVWKMLLAGLWYLLVVSLSLSFLTDPPEGSTLFDNIGQAGIVLIGGFGLALFLLDYRGIWGKLHIDRINSPFLRRMAAFLCAVTLALVFMLGYIAVGSLLMRMGVIPPE